MMGKTVCTVIWLGASAWMDFRRKRVSIGFLAVTALVVTGMWIGGMLRDKTAAAEMLFSLLPGGMLTVAALLSKHAGWADGVILMLLGMSAGLRRCVVSFTVSILAISIVSLVLLTAKRVHRDTKIPYLPFLWVGYVAQLLLETSV